MVGDRTGKEYLGPLYFTSHIRASMLRVPTLGARGAVCQGALALGPGSQHAALLSTQAPAGYYLITG